MWKAIPGYEGKYEVSDGGQVASLNYNKTGDRRLLTQGLSRDYPSVELAAKRFTVHRLVMMAFVGPRPDGMQINHINGIKTDNRLENLEYCTASANQRHSFTIGLQDNRGEMHSQCKLNDEKVRKVRSMLETGMSQGLIARLMGVDQAVISNIKTKKAWSHVQ